MRIHTNTLAESDLYTIMDAARDKAPEVYVMIDSVHGSRTHARAYEVKLRGCGARHRRHSNSGTYGASADMAATWADWGWFLGEAFKRDGTIKAGPYSGWRDFHVRTKNKFNRCEFCQGTADVEISEDPFASDVYNDDTPVSICRWCQSARADEI